MVVVCSLMGSDFPTLQCRLAIVGSIGDWSIVEVRGWGKCFVVCTGWVVRVSGASYDLLDKVVHANRCFF
jgi:hypothetical protein